MSPLNGSVWRGNKLKISEARPDYKARHVLEEMEEAELDTMQQEEVDASDEPDRSFNIKTPSGTQLTVPQDGTGTKRMIFRPVAPRPLQECLTLDAENQQSKLYHVNKLWEDILESARNRNSPSPTIFQQSRQTEFSKPVQAEAAPAAPARLQSYMPYFSSDEDGAVGDVPGEAVVFSDDDPGLSTPSAAARLHPVRLIPAYNSSDDDDPGGLGATPGEQLLVARGRNSSPRPGVSGAAGGQRGAAGDVRLDGWDGEDVPIDQLGMGQDMLLGGWDAEALEEEEAECAEAQEHAGVGVLQQLPGGFSRDGIRAVPVANALDTSDVLEDVLEVAQSPASADLLAWDAAGGGGGAVETGSTDGEGSGMEEESGAVEEEVRSSTAGESSGGGSGRMVAAAADAGGSGGSGNGTSAEIGGEGSSASEGVGGGPDSGSGLGGAGADAADSEGGGSESAGAAGQQPDGPGVVASAWQRVFALAAGQADDEEEQEDVEGGDSDEKAEGEHAGGGGRGEARAGVVDDRMEAGDLALDGDGAAAAVEAAEEPAATDRVVEAEEAAAAADEGGAAAEVLTASTAKAGDGAAGAQEAAQARGLPDGARRGGWGTGAGRGKRPREQQVPDRPDRADRAGVSAARAGARAAGSGSDDGVPEAGAALQAELQELAGQVAAERAAFRQGKKRKPRHEKPSHKKPPASEGGAEGGKEGGDADTEKRSDGATAAPTGKLAKLFRESKGAVADAVAVPEVRKEEQDSVVKALFSEVPFQATRATLAKPTVKEDAKPVDRARDTAAVPDKLEKATDYIKKVQSSIVPGPEEQHPGAKFYRSEDLAVLEGRLKAARPSLNADFRSKLRTEQKRHAAVKQLAQKRRRR
eukprot:jgi/Ulvmu1/2616/UM014_0067.1